jgi:molecular chaperone DnaK (HSP70)
MVKNTVVMVLDCGGGTVDITIHRLTCNPDEKFLCEELLPSSGGCEWGSKYVDLHFENFLEDFFGEDNEFIWICVRGGKGTSLGLSNSSSSSNISTRSHS